MKNEKRSLRKDWLMRMKNEKLKMKNEG